MRRRDVLRALGLANSSFYAMIARGGFPRGIKITQRCVAWRRSVVVEFMNSREQDAAYESAALLDVSKFKRNRPLCVRRIVFSHEGARQ